MSAEQRKKRSDGPAVSVVIAAYNEEQYIAEAVESVLAQTFRDFEVIVVDDGSTDRTPEIVRAYAQEQHAQEQHVRVRYLHQPNSGQPAARNRGIRAARGRYVAFLDADDLWLPAKLERQMQLLRSSPERAWVYCDAYRFESATGHIRRVASQGSGLCEGDVLRPLLLGNFIVSLTPVVRRGVFEDVGYFEEAPFVRGGGGEDWDMWLRIAGRYPVGVVRAPLGKSRLAPQSMTGTMDLDHALRGRLKVVRRALRAHPQQAGGVSARALSNVYARFGRRALSREERAQARRLFGRALQHDPTNLLAWRYGLAALLPRPLLRLLGRVRRRYWRAAAQASGPPANQGA